MPDFKAIVTIGNKEVANTVYTGVESIESIYTSLRREYGAWATITFIFLGTHHDSTF